MISEPDLIRYTSEKFLAQIMEQVSAAKLQGAVNIWIGDGFSDIISPDMFKDFSIAYMLPLIEEIRRLGLKSIYYYTGNPARKLELIIGSGADAIAFEESKKGFDTDMIEIADAVKGRSALLGNIDSISVMQDGSDDELKAEILRQLDSAKMNKNRFVMSIGSPLTPSTSVDKVRLYCDLVHGLT